jgi:hypothetical protein
VSNAQRPPGNPKTSTGGARSSVQPDRLSGRSRTWLWLLIVTALALSAAAAVVASLLSHVHYGGGTMDRLRLGGGLTRSAKQRDQKQEPAAEQMTDAGARVAPFIGSSSDAPPLGEQNPPTGQDFERLGDHVGSILSAAEEAAVRIREEAQQEAERVRERAANEAAAHAEAARQEADAIKADAERLRAEAEESTTQTRQAADTYAADRRAEAEAVAQELLAAAERQAMASNEKAERRQHALETYIARTEDRLLELASGLHELAARLDELLAVPIGEGDGASAEGDESSLLAALEVPRETQATTA